MDARRLRLALIGDVFDHAEQTLLPAQFNQFAVAAADDQPAVPPEKLDLHVPDRAILAEPPDHFVAVGGIIPQTQFGGSAPDYFLAPVTGDAFKTHVHVEITSRRQIRYRQ